MIGSGQGFLLALLNSDTIPGGVQGSYENMGTNPGFILHKVKPKSRS